LRPRTPTRCAHDIGFDYQEHVSYARQLIYDHSIPSRGSGRNEYYTPPLFYLVFGAAIRFAYHFGATFPDKVARAMNVPLLVGTAVLVFVLARLLWPTRRPLHLAALGFFVFLPVTIRLASMFHPETMSLFLSTLALTIGAWMLARRDFRTRTAVALGVALGLAQLVRATTLWTFAVVVLALLLAALARAAPPRAILRATVVTVLATAVVTAPWYIRQTIDYGNAVFAQSAPKTPLYDRRPVSFYTALGLPDVFDNPTRPHFTNDFLPTSYSEIWGDYFGSWSWIAPNPPLTEAGTSTDVSKRDRAAADAARDRRLPRAARAHGDPAGERPERRRTSGRPCAEAGRRRRHRLARLQARWRQARRRRARASSGCPA